MSSTATAVSVSTPAATPTVSVLPPTADLSIEPNSAQDAATGQLFRVAVRARKRDGSDARGAHVLFTPAAGSISLEVLDPDVLASGSPTIAEARIFAEPGQLGNAIIEARVAGSDSVPRTGWSPASASR